MTRIPPPAAVRLLRLCVSDAAFESIAGDLDEEFARGRGAAWYWVFTIRSIGAHAFGRVPEVVRSCGWSLRQLRRQPLYAAAVIGTLTLAVATATASAAVIRRAFVDPIAYPDADRLVSILTTLDGSTSAVSAPVFADISAGGGPFDRFAAIRPISPTLRADDATVGVDGSLVTPEYFDLLGARPVLGQAWTAPSDPAVVVSWRFFTTRLAGDPAAVGRRITIDDTPRTVTGVLPEDFVPPYWPRTDVWMPLDLAALANEARGRRQLTVLARRGAGHDQAVADAYLAGLSTRLQQQYPVEHGRNTWIARPLAEVFTADARPALLGVAAAAGLLLVIVCANIGGLSAARAISQQHQQAIRGALGASRRRLLCEQLGDSLCLATLGTIGGLSLAPLLVALAARYQREFLDRVPPFALEGTTLAIGLAIGLLAGVASGLLPARLLGRAGAGQVLQATSRSLTGTRRITLTRQVLVVAQVAFALVLLIGTGLLLRTVQHLTRVQPGFTTAGMTSFQVTMPGARFRSEAQHRLLEDDVLARLRHIPGVVSATASDGLPAGATMGASLHVEGRVPTGGLPEVGYTSIAPGFLEQMGVPLEKGRDIATSDAFGMTGAILVNRTMARQVWPGGDAIGARIYLGPGRPQPGEWMQVVGIVGDVRPSVLQTDIRPTAYGSTRQYSWPRRYFTVFAPSQPPTLAADLRAAVRAADPAVSIGTIQYLPDIFAGQQARHRLVMIVLGVFALVSLVLSASGLYAVVAMTSQMRRREYAIRVALGAARQHVRWQVARQALGLTLAGIAAGIGFALLAVRTIRSLLHGVEAGDGVTFAGAALLLASLATAAAWWPARQAARVDPVEALKSET